jgi:hypothetical protein
MCVVTIGFIKHSILPLKIKKALVRTHTVKKLTAMYTLAFNYSHLIVIECNDVTDFRLDFFNNVQ